MTHKVRMGDDGILRVSFWGEMGQDEWQAYHNDISSYVEAAIAEGKQLPVIIDARQAGKVSAAARRSIAGISDQPGTLKVAVVGVSRYHRLVATVLSKARGRGPANLFASEEDAVTWLQSAVPSAVKRKD
jgi:hypothetical protein